MNPTLALAVIGLGGAGTRYANALSRGEISGARLVAVCDELLERCRPFQAPAFVGAEALLSQASAAAVVIATPHLSHCALAQAALKAGLHVLVEKPLGVHKLQCERALAVHGQLGPRRPLFGVVHNYRADPIFQRLKVLVSSGGLGSVHRVIWQATHWFRTNAYYTRSPWRGHYATEGGGVLVNQAPHVLDTLLWLFGPVRRVRGECRFGAFHDTEVEDDVSAELEFVSGARALLVLGTGEAPGTHRLEIAGDGGRAVLEHGSLSIQRNRELSSVFGRRERSGAPTVDVEHVPAPEGVSTGLEVLSNFVDAVRGRAALLAPAEQALPAVELSNAILWSSLIDRRLELPIDGLEFERVWSALGAQRRPRVAAIR